jgi:hypothetical protein
MICGVGRGNFFDTTPHCLAFDASHAIDQKVQAQKRMNSNSRGVSDWS